MKEWREYQCDYGHSWTVVREQGTEEYPGDAICTSGHEAVTCIVKVPADAVSILLEPDARVRPNGPDERVDFHGWVLVLTDREGRELARSAESLAWPKAVEIAREFVGRSSSEAVRIAQRILAKKKDTGGG